MLLEIAAALERTKLLSIVHAEYQATYGRQPQDVLRVGDVYIAKVKQPKRGGKLGNTRLLVFVTEVSQTGYKLSEFHSGRPINSNHQLDFLCTRRGECKWLCCEYPVYLNIHIVCMTSRGMNHPVTM